MLNDVALSLRYHEITVIDFNLARPEECVRHRERRKRSGLSLGNDDAALRFDWNGLLVFQPTELILGSVAAYVIPCET